VKVFRQAGFLKQTFVTFKKKSRSILGGFSLINFPLRFLMFSIS